MCASCLHGLPVRNLQAPRPIIYNSLCDDNAPSTVVSGSSADRSEEDARRSSTARAAKDSIESNHGNAVAEMVVFPSPTKSYVDTKRYRVGERRVGRKD